MAKNEFANPSNTNLSLQYNHFPRLWFSHFPPAFSLCNYNYSLVVLKTQPHFDSIRFNSEKKRSKPWTHANATGASPCECKWLRSGTDLMLEELKEEKKVR